MKFISHCNSLSDDSKDSLSMLKDAIDDADHTEQTVIELLRNSCEYDSAIDDMTSYDTRSAWADLKYILKGFIIENLESEASRIIKSGESFDKLSQIRVKISELTANKLP